MVPKSSDIIDMNDKRPQNGLLTLSARREWGLALALTLLALCLRLWGVETVPPGWRDDELINSLVISQKVLDGDLALYYPDASGHEALYHALNAVMLGLFGPGVPGIRWLSVLLGTLTVPLTYLVGRRLFSVVVGAAAALVLSVSFWSLMYSRIGLRHILMPVLVLAAFAAFWRGLVAEKAGTPPARRALLGSAVWVGLGFYTYFAGRGVPLILLTFLFYLALVKREQLRRRWRETALAFALILALALPLAVALGRQPEAEGRVAELAVPIAAAREGDFGPLRDYTVTTLRMFHGDGDPEWLYNIPGRPLFGPVGALFFWSGVGIALWLTLRPFWFRRRAARTELAGAFLLIWWLAGISPAFVSVPPASLGHTILAQPATYLLAALPLGIIASARRPLFLRRFRAPLVGLLALLLAGSVAARDLPDYFQNWPERGMTRFLYRADIGAVAGYLGQNPTPEVGIASLLAGPWDRVAFELEMEGETAVSPRWFNPERAALLTPATSFTDFPLPLETTPYADWYRPLQDVNGDPIRAGGYTLHRATKTLPPGPKVCFRNGLCWIWAAYDPETAVLRLGWRAERPLTLPPQPLISNPPPPGVYSGPRLAVFAQLWGENDQFLAGDDGLWVDPATLRGGDVFVQEHRPALPEGATPLTAVIGLYDPKTGKRVLTEAEEDHVWLPLATLINGE